MQRFFARYVSKGFTKNAGDLWSVSRRVQCALSTLMTHGREVLHPLSHGRRDAEKASARLERVEWCRGAAKPPRTGWRHAQSQVTSGAEFRSGLRVHQDSPLGPVALNPLADFLPFIESPHFHPGASRRRGFFFSSRPEWNRILICRRRV